MQIVKDTMSKVGERVQMLKDKINEFMNVSDNNGTHSNKNNNSNDNENKVSNADVPHHLKNDFKKQI